MLLLNHFHTTYCTNIHAGETWVEVFKNLKEYVLPLKNKLAPHQSFGIGLRLSNLAAEELIKPLKIVEFKNWLTDNDCYVFTMNGFPYGEFHDTVVKDNVHKPDWSNVRRYNYTEKLIDILAQIAVPNSEVGISISPISYKPWLNHTQTQEVFITATLYLVQLTEKLNKIHVDTGLLIHLDIEPEPDGLIENSDELITYFEEYLLTQGADSLMNQLSINHESACQIIKRHIQVCYDVCHFSLAYESPIAVLEKLNKHQIKVGKIQISAAVKAIIDADKSKRAGVAEALNKFAESTYLHQVTELFENGTINQFRDLQQALQIIDNTNAVEWKTHFHVPIFLPSYGVLQSTQSDIVAVLDLLKKNYFTQHLEIETYTWDVLPADLKTTMADAIEREYSWLIGEMEK